MMRGFLCVSLYVKVLLIGESGVGKSTLVGRLCEDRFMPEHRQYTLGEPLLQSSVRCLRQQRTKRLQIRNIMQQHTARGTSLFYKLCSLALATKHQAYM